MVAEGKLFDVMRAEHGHLKALMAQTSSALHANLRHAALKKSYELLRRELTRLSLAEEDLLYPRMHERHFTSDFAHISKRQQETIEKHMSRLDELNPGEPRWVEHYEALREGFFEHVELEEDKVFPAIERTFEPAELTRIAATMQRFFDGEHGGL